MNFPIEIPLSKSKLILMFAGCLMFVGLGIWLVFSPPQINNAYYGSPLKMLIAGIAGIIFFGLMGIFLLIKLMNTSPGLIISNEGIFDNSSGISVGLVVWSDITEIRGTQIANQKFIVVLVKNPEEYIENQRNAFKRKVIQMNYKHYGSVINISANGLKIKHRELKEMLDKKFQEFKKV